MKKWIIPLSMMVPIYAGILVWIWAYADSKRGFDTLLEPAYSTDALGNPQSRFKAGDTMFVRWHIRRTRNCTTQRVIRRITNGVVVPLTEHNGKFAKRYKDGFSVSVDIPRFLQPGKYRYEVELFTKCNPFFDSHREYPPVHFEVKE